MASYRRYLAGSFRFRYRPSGILRPTKTNASYSLICPWLEYVLRVFDRLCEGLNNLPLIGIKSDIGRRVGVAENVVLISVRDGDEVNTTPMLVDYVQITRQPVDRYGDRLQYSYDHYLST